MDVGDTLITVAEDEVESLTMASQDEDVIQRVKTLAQNGDIEKFYDLLDEDPNVLERFDRDSFCETPLHVAARNGQTHFAMEIMNLKPSLAWKLNKSGFSPVHLALQNGCVRTVRGVIAVDSNLASIKGRGRITPLHFVAQNGDNDLLSEFLLACPSSIEDLTIKCETAVHIAVRNHRFESFKVLFGWLKRVNREDVLNWKDDDGNTVFHIATSTNQVEVMELLRKVVNVNAKNVDGQTAMDIFRINRDFLSPTMSKILRGAKRASKLKGSATTLAGYLSSKLSLLEKRNKLLGLNYLCSNTKRSKSASDLRSAVLVVAVLIATATYQAGFTPPGGYRQEDQQKTELLSSGEHFNRTIHFAGEMIMDPFDAYFFYSLNGVAFFASISVILILIVGLPMWTVLYGSILALGVANFASFSSTMPMVSYDSTLYGIALVFEYPIIITVILSTLFIAFRRNESRSRRVDFHARYFSSTRDLTSW